MREVLELEALGYTFSLDGGIIRYRCKVNQADPETSRELLRAIKTKKDEVARYLQARRSAKPIWQYLYKSADRAYARYQKKVRTGELEMALQELMRWSRIHAAAAQAEGLTHPPTSWEEWLACFDEVLFGAPTGV